MKSRECSTTILCCAPIPPPNRNLSQRERVQLIVALIRENQRVRGANRRVVVSESDERGIDREQTLNDHIRKHKNIKIKDSEK